MIKFLLPTFLIVIAGFLFFGYTNSLFGEVNELRQKSGQLNELLSNGATLRESINSKNEQYNQFSKINRERLNKMLPDNVDNVQLIIDIDDIALKRGLNIRNISVDTGAATAGNSLGGDNRPYGTATLTFSISAPYELFRLFLKDLENSLRLVDVESLSFSSGNINLYDYTLKVRTYWLK